MLRSRSLDSSNHSVSGQFCQGGGRSWDVLHFALDSLVVRAEGALEHGGHDLLLARLDLLGGFLPPAHGALWLLLVCSWSALRSSLASLEEEFKNATNCLPTTNVRTVVPYLYGTL
jgi:hypothetical protein